MASYTGSVQPGRTFYAVTSRSRAGSSASVRLEASVFHHRGLAICLRDRDNPAALSVSSHTVRVMPGERSRFIPENAYPLNSQLRAGAKRSGEADG